MTEQQRWEIGDIMQHMLTDDDIAAWHNGDLTENVKMLMSEFGFVELQIWGSRTGNEPFLIIVK